MGGSAHLNFTAGGLVAAGGLVGYARAGSFGSLMGGGACGAGLIAAGVLIQRGQDFEGHALGLGWGTVLAGSMGSRFFRTGKFMPAGLAAGIGLVAALYNGTKANDWKDSWMSERA